MGEQAQGCGTAAAVRKPSGGKSAKPEMSAVCAPALFPSGHSRPGNQNRKRRKQRPHAQRTENIARWSRVCMSAGRLCPAHPHQPHKTAGIVDLSRFSRICPADAPPKIGGARLVQLPIFPPARLTILKYFCPATNALGSGARSRMRTAAIFPLDKKIYSLYNAVVGYNTFKGVTP